MYPLRRQFVGNYRNETCRRTGGEPVRIARPGHAGRGDPREKAGEAGGEAESPEKDPGTRWCSGRDRNQRCRNRSEPTTPKAGPLRKRGGTVKQARVRRVRSGPGV